MSRVWTPWLVAAAVALAGDASAAVDLKVVHAPIECVPASRYARVVAGGAPAENVARAELQFRVRPDAAWYGVPMTADGASWSATLPRPIAPLTQFEYRIVMTAPDLGTAETAALPVRVADDPAQCAAQSSIAVASPIVVRVPPGAPLVPPVPPGFSPAGVVAPAGPEPRDKWKAVKWIAGAGAAAGIGAVAAGLGSAPPELPDVPDFAFSGTVPNPGGDFSLSRDRLTVFVLVSGDPRAPVTFTWFFQLRPVGRPDACLTMTDTATIGSARPELVELSATMRQSGFCGTTYQVDSGRLTIVVEGQVVRDVTQELPFRIVP